MENTLKALNDLVEAGALERYAIGGAIGALFYIETLNTQDLDVFCTVPADEPALDPFSRLNTALKARRYEFDREFVIIEGVPVQFLPASRPLEIDALEKAALKPYSSDVSALVLTAEHLAAIALQTGRAKDYQRVELFLTQVPDLDIAFLRELIVRYALAERLAVFRARYPESAALLVP